MRGNLVLEHADHIFGAMGGGIHDAHTRFGQGRTILRIDADREMRVWIACSYIGAMRSDRMGSALHMGRSQ